MTALTILGCIVALGAVIYFCWGDDHGRNL